MACSKVNKGSIVIGVSVEIDGIVVDDSTWLRKRNDYSYTRVTELDTTIKSVNLALKWKLKNVETRSDSATVLCWTDSVITETN